MSAAMLCRSDVRIRSILGAAWDICWKPHDDVLLVEGEEEEEEVGEEEE